MCDCQQWRSPQLQLGFSFVVMWAGRGQISSPIKSNAGEMALAAGLAKAHGFERCRQQPRECHMQHFRQVLTPSGIFACPAHRGNQRTRIGDRTAYCIIAGFADAFATTQAQIQRFDADAECREVTCIYNGTNWWLEDLIESGEELTPGVAADLFL